MIRRARPLAALAAALVPCCSAGEIRLLEGAPAAVAPDAAGDGAAEASGGTGGVPGDATPCPPCDGDEVCHPLSGACLDRCATDGDCSSGSRPLCELPPGACVECRADADCDSDRPFCFATSCVECVVNSDCTDPADPLCAPDHQCRH